MVWEGGGREASPYPDQLREAFPYDTAPRYLVFDRDAIFSPAVVEFIRAMGTKPVRISYRQPLAKRYRRTLDRKLPPRDVRACSCPQ